MSVKKKKFIINFFLGLALNNSIVVYAQEEELGKYEWIKEELDIKPFDFLTMRENFILYDQDQSSVDSQLSDMCYYKYNIEDKTNYPAKNFIVQSYAIQSLIYAKQYDNTNLRYGGKRIKASGVVYLQQYFVW